MTPSKKWSCPQVFIFAIFWKSVAFCEKIVRLKNIQFLVSRKKGYIHFRRRTTTSLQKGFGPQKRFFAFISENTAFFEKVVE